MADVATRAAAANFRLREADPDDIGPVVALLQDDPISAARSPCAASEMALQAAFVEIRADANNELWVAEAADGAIAATWQLTFIPGLSRNGMRRAQVEAVRVRSDLRGQGLGRRLMQHAIERARERGCGLLQLTSDLRREDAHRFYRDLGFAGSHLGMKLALLDT